MAPLVRSIDIGIRSRSKQAYGLSLHQRAGTAHGPMAPGLLASMVTGSGNFN